MKTTKMSPREVMGVARQAVERLVKHEGLDATFPLDKIWQYAATDVPSKQRAGNVGNKLIKDKYLELTGGYVPAVSQTRAQSPTREYRPGQRFRATERQSTRNQQTPAEELRKLSDAYRDLGYVTTPAQLANFYLALLTSSFVILAGPSGTGKSKLPRLFAALAGLQFYSIPVQPQWSDNSDLLGYVPTLDPGAFIPGPMITPLQSAIRNPGSPVLVLLDEMNLASVEHYFSDFLSVMETRRRKGTRILSDALPLSLPHPPAGESDRYLELRGLELPSNFFLIGTANMDETTREFSRKVLDRAFSIELDDVDLTTFPVPDGGSGERPNNHFASRLADPKRPLSVGDVVIDARLFFEQIGAILHEIREILYPAGISIGYRTRDAICLYCWHWRQENLADVLPFSAALDLCILQKVLPHINGSGDSLRKALEDLNQWLKMPGREVRFDDDTYPASSCPKSLERVRSLIQQLDDFGSCNFWA